MKSCNLGRVAANSPFNGVAVRSRWAICLSTTVALLLGSQIGQAQDADGPKADPAKAAAAPKTGQDAAQPPAADPAPAAGDSAPAAPPESFDEVLDEWKTVLKDLRELQIRYKAANEAEGAQMREQWTALLKKGEAMLPRLQKSAIGAYKLAPNDDRVLVRFLLKVLQDSMASDQFESAAELAQVMIDNKCDAKEIYNHPGVANFALHNFDKAEQYLAEAAGANALAPEAAQYLDAAKQYKDLWSKEQAVRKAEAAANDLPRVKLTTSAGEMTIELYENEAPNTVANFISLVESGFYDGLTFHRVLPGFMAQGGCPRGDGTGGPGYEIKCECFTPKHRRHFRGTLSMAHAGRDTGGSQFFITFTPTPGLNGKHTAFGRVIEGMDVLSKLQRRDPMATPPLPTPDKIIKAEVIRKREHEYSPVKVQ